MKTSRFKQSYRKNSSKLHKRVGEILRASSIFSGNKIYQEYPVNKINPDYPHANHFFDWVILDLKIIIECHGEQHYYGVSFGGVSVEDAQDRFVSQKHRDRQKADAAVQAGFTYLVIPYHQINSVSDAFIWGLYQEHVNSDPVKRAQKKQPSEYEIQLRDRAKKRRQEQHKRQQEWIKNNKQE